MAKIGCLKPFRGSWNGMKDYVLEDGEIAFTTDNKRIYIGNGTDSISNLTPFADIGEVDISSIGTGSITSAINTINSKIPSGGSVSMKVITCKGSEIYSKINEEYSSTRNRVTWNFVTLDLGSSFTMIHCTGNSFTFVDCYPYYSTSFKRRTISVYFTNGSATEYIVEEAFTGNSAPSVTVSTINISNTNVYLMFLQ